MDTRINISNEVVIPYYCYAIIQTKCSPTVPVHTYTHFGLSTKIFQDLFPKFPSLFFWSMALRRIDKKKAVTARTARPRAVAIAARQALLARTQRNSLDYSVADSPESPAIQAAPLLNLSVPKSQLTSGLAVMSLHPAPVLPASAEIPASTEIPDSTEIPASAAIPRTIAPPTQYVPVGEKAPKLSAITSRQQAVEITQLLLSKDTPFTPVDVIHQSNYLAMETLLMKKFATDPPRRDDCAFWKTRSNQRFCRELLISAPDNAVSKSDKFFKSHLSLSQGSFSRTRDRLGYK
jgi:hypothetical protein